MQDVLVIAENFSFGGMETSIAGCVKAGRACGLRFHLVCGNDAPATGPSVDWESILAGLPLGPRASASELLGCVERLCAHIEERQISLIIAHPFISYIPALIAAERTRVPVVVVVHGPSSAGGFYGAAYDLLLQRGVFANASAVLAVSEETYDLVAPYCDRARLRIQRNAVDAMGWAGAEAHAELEGDWLVASRLDEAKVAGLERFLLAVGSLGHSVALVGDGPASSRLAEFVRNRALDHVRFLGRRDDVPSLMRRFRAVAGMGRVVLEAVAADRPICLVGYDGIKGFLDRRLFEQAAWCNFSGRNLIDLPFDQVREALRLPHPSPSEEGWRLTSDHDESLVWARFFTEARFLDAPAPGLASRVFDALHTGLSRSDEPYLSPELIASLIDAGPVHFPAARTAPGGQPETALRQVLLTEVSHAAHAVSQLRRDQENRFQELKQLLQAARLPEGNPGPPPKAAPPSPEAPLPELQDLRERVDRSSQLILDKLEQLRLQQKSWPSRAWRKIKSLARQRRTGADPASAAVPADPSLSPYLREQHAQAMYLSRYTVEEGIAEQDRATWGRLSEKLQSSRPLVIYPLSYPRELRQRPDHVLRFLAGHGYDCIILSLEDGPAYFERVSPGLYVSNLFAATVSQLRNRECVLYITYPFFRYLTAQLRNAQVVYDVLDDLSVFSMHGEHMASDHEQLLRQSKAVLFSSNVLLERNASRCRAPALLVTNGVWKDDFRSVREAHDRRDARKSSAVTLGYHGAITELLDWRLLERLLEDPRINLLMIGPVTEFDDETAERVAEVRDRVLRHPRVKHVPPVPYEDLPRYLGLFDAGIVPFIVNEKTDPVSPLKLFEYMACGLPVFATPTATLREYSQYVTVASASELPGAVDAWISQRETGGDPPPGYEEVLDKVDWDRQLQPLLSLIQPGSASTRRSGTRRKRRVDLVNINFFDWSGRVLYKGGAERYVFDLAKLLESEGWAPRILQNGTHPFQIDFQGVPVIGVPSRNGHDVDELSRVYARACREADLVVASPLDLACRLELDCPVVGINHGIHWDHKGRRLPKSLRDNHSRVFNAVRACDAVVCVDTNFINWFRTFDRGLSRKLRYVPNYFDSAQFSLREKHYDGKVVFLYPRRLYEARGIFMTLEVFDSLLVRHPGIELHLVGQAGDDDRAAIQRFVDRHPQQVRWYELDKDDMHKAYEESHVALIPTLYSEGTSLSCLEAMATGNAVIATNIGGLPNLVVDGYNGLLIEPEVAHLQAAVELLLQDRSQIERMAANGVAMARCFEKRRWEQRWQQIITEVVQ